MVLKKEKTNPSTIIDVSSNEQNHSNKYYCPNDCYCAQNLTIDFVVENYAPYEVEYKNMVASISYEGNIIWLNILDLYRQQKGERSSVRVTFGNFSVKIMDDYVAYSINKENRTSGFVVFTVEVKEKYDSKYYMKVFCGDMRFKFSSNKQKKRLLQKCSTGFFYCPHLM
ncbi:hypothetical protein P3L10_020113 [Capsicum annuum]